jgi:hypothetical protein
MVTVLEDFIPKSYQDFLEKNILSKTFPFYFSGATTDYAIEGNYMSPYAKEVPFLVHTFLSDRPQPTGYWPIIAPLYFNFCEKTGKNYTIVRCKANLYFQAPDFGKDNYYTPHVDYTSGNITTAIYYVIDSDGDTLFFDKDLRITERISPKKGSLVYFDRSVIHTGTPPVRSTHRCVINFNFALS